MNAQSFLVEVMIRFMAVRQCNRSAMRNSAAIEGVGMSDPVGR